MLRTCIALSWSLLFWVLGCAHAAPAPSAPRPPAPAPVTLRLASTYWPPFTGAPDEPHIALDLVARALQRAGYASSLEMVDEGSLAGVLAQGAFDGAAAIWHSEEREQFLLYSRPYLENRLMLVATKGHAVDAHSLDELKGKKLGVVAGYACGEELESSAAPQLVPATSSEENLRALLNGTVDYVLVDDLVIHHLLERYPKEARERLEVGARPLITRSLHLAIQKRRPDARRIVEGFDRALAGMLADGSYNDLLGVAWLRADVDGDGRPELIASQRSVGADPPRDYYDLVATVNAPAAGVTSDDPGNARFVIRGVSYDSWSAVPDEHKTETDDLAAKPRTLRVEIFEF